MRRFFCILASAVALVASATGLSDSNSLPDRQIDSLLTSHKLVYIDGRPADAGTQEYVDSIRRKISEFYYDQFRAFSDPAAPYFMFLSKDASLAMGIGGAVRMRAYYDWGGAMPTSAFVPYLIPMHPSPVSMRHLGTTPAGTCLYFKVFGRNKMLGDYQLYIEGNFSGYESRDFKIKKAYAIVNDFTVGYASSTFSDPAALPPIVDAQGPNNKIAPTSVLVRYMPVVRDKWVFAASVEMPSSAVDADNDATQAVDNWMPDFAAFAQYQWARGQHVRLSGVVRTLSYRGVAAATNHNIAGWGLQLSSVAHPAAPVTTYATLNYGHGYAGLGGDLMMGRYDLVGDPAKPGKMYAPASFGWCLGVQYNIRPNLFVSASASATRYLPSHEVAPDEYKRGMFGAVNVFWNLTPRMQVAAELDLGMRRNFSGEHRYARRAGLMCMFSF